MSSLYADFYKRANLSNCEGGKTFPVKTRIRKTDGKRHYDVLKLAQV